MTDAGVGVVLTAVVVAAALGFTAVVVVAGFGFVAVAVVVADTALASFLRNKKIVHDILLQNTMTPELI